MLDRFLMLNLPSEQFCRLRTHTLVENSRGITQLLGNDIQHYYKENTKSNCQVNTATSERILKPKCSSEFSLAMFITFWQKISENRYFIGTLFYYSSITERWEVTILPAGIFLTTSHASSGHRLYQDAN